MIRDYYDEDEVKDFVLNHEGNDYECLYVSHFGSVFELDQSHYKKINMTGGKVCMLGFIDEKPFKVDDRVMLDTGIETFKLIVRDATYRWIQGMKVFYFMCQEYK